MAAFTHDFEASVKKVHDELFASANIRTPETLQEEFTKVFLGLQYGLQGGSSAKNPNFFNLEIDSTWIIDVFTKYAAKNRAYSKDETIKLDPRSITFIANELSRYDLATADRDWLGDALEVFRSTAAKRLGGQFFTDQRVTDLAIGLLEYDPKRDQIVDTCAGTGGFLIAAGKKARELGLSKVAGIHGIEIDSKLSHLANSTLNHLNSQFKSSVFNGDSLKPDSWNVELRDSISEDSVDMIASNPPFGIKITIKDPDVMKKHELSYVWSNNGGEWFKTDRNTFRAPDILFLERNLKLVKPGTGKIALVLPYQILSGPKTGYIREWLLRNAEIIAVIDLPDDTFQPWTGTKTSLLVCRRREKPLDKWSPEKYKIFMSISEHIGHDRRGKPVLDEQGRVVTDLPAILDAFEDWKLKKRNFAGTTKSFEISALELNANNDLRMNASFFDPEAHSAREDFPIGLSTEDFTVFRLGDLVEKVVCPGRFKRRYVEKSDGGVPFLGGSNISQYSISTKKFLAKDDPTLGELIVQEGWILITRSGSTGIVSSVPKSWSGFAMSEHVIRIIPKPKADVPFEYIESFLRSSLGQTLVAAGVFGSVIDEITPDQIEAIPIPVPKDKKILRSIVESQKQANAGRELAASSTMRAVEQIDLFHLQLA